ncbi:acetyl-CoA carboxylase biotin carboxyl carrier protein subunit [Reichenbachiella agarivorans]|uniref:Acetyl-CoA carboxylase biotin carboxyl carrier protein subunit n=1 Tax=Reichenbachiella agarivorans TaxID=2979464 RepID=A0ABY6CQX8_9BACT|nr:acetyl-CoA carboxylase biotin carboxyl carrier protein subunit [Reichenbachiella agarivorans]UXP32907.1 acetyl-CoA carboxylase biotin carboxyl carrier protein subunit [Reichenbachiella agarivorans]
MKKITINKSTFELEEVEGAFFLNAKPYSLDMYQRHDGSIHIEHGCKSHLVEIVSVDAKTKTVSMIIDGRAIQAHVQDELDLMLEKIGLESDIEATDQEIKAPMPGTILEICVKEGQSVAKGDSLVILEAMKMENIIKSPCDGVLTSILVTKGETVEKGKILLIF